MFKIISIASRRLKHNALNCGINVTRRQNIKSTPVSRQFYKIMSHRPPHQQIVMKRWQKFHTSYHLMKIETIKVPPFADSISEGDIKFTCKVGDHVKADQVVMEVETDKTTVGVPAPFAGVIKEILVKEGQTVKANQELFKLEAAAGGAAPAPSPSKPAAPAPPSKPAAATPKPAAAAPKPAVPVAPQPAAVPQPAVAAAPKPTVAVAPQPAVATPPSAPPQATSKPASPAASAPRAAAVPMPKAQPTTMKIPPKDYSREIVGTRTEQRVKMNRMRQKISSRLKDAQNITASLTTFNEIDMSSAMAFRKANLEAFTKQYKTKIGFMSMFSKAAAYALQDQPVINAVIQGDEIVYRDYVDISVAVATPKGLVVPVIRNVESMNFADIEIALAALGDKARKGKITVEDMDGGTFTISNGGVFGSLMGTPIINLPQSSILGMHGIFDRPIAIKKQVVIRPMMYIALTYDHRLIDGREAVLFLRKIKSAVEDPRIMLAGL